MDLVLLLAIVSVIVILLFDVTNGFHDASNMIATVVASRAMTPIQAVMVVGTFHFIGPILGGTAVANTIGKFIDVSSLDVVVSLTIILCGLSGAIFWNLLTWWFAIPSSSSHALVGGLIGAVVLASGPEHVVWGFGQLLHGELTGVTKVVLALIISPFIGFWVGFGLHRLMGFLLQGARPSMNGKLRRVQWLTAAGLSFSHGANDAQKSMGIITMVLVLGRLYQRVCCSPVGRPVLCDYDDPGHANGRVAYCAHRGIRYLQGAATARRECPVDVCRGDIWCIDDWGAGVHNPRGKFFHYGHRRFGATQGGALGQGPGNNKHLVDHYTWRGAGCSGGVLAGSPDYRGRLMKRQWHNGGVRNE